MSFPALGDFEDDLGVTLSRWRVYNYLRKRQLTFVHAKAVKILTIMLGSRVGRRDAIAALDWLVAQGYLVEHARDHAKATRVFSLAYSRPAAAN